MLKRATTCFTKKFNFFLYTKCNLSFLLFVFVLKYYLDMFWHVWDLPIWLTQMKMFHSVVSHLVWVSVAFKKKSPPTVIIILSYSAGVRLQSLISAFCSNIDVEGFNTAQCQYNSPPPHMHIWSKILFKMHFCCNIQPIFGTPVTSSKATGLKVTRL